MSGIWLKFGFQLPNDVVLELAGKHSSCSERISWQAMGIWLRIHVSGQRLMHRLLSTIIFRKMWSLKCQFENLAEQSLLNKKSMLILNLKYMFIHRLHINHQKCWLWRNPALWGRCYAESNIRHEDFCSVVGSSVTLRGSPLDSEMGWTGELWSNGVFLTLEN